MQYEVSLYFLNFRLSTVLIELILSLFFSIALKKLIYHSVERQIKLGYSQNGCLNKNSYQKKVKEDYRKLILSKSLKLKFLVSCENKNTKPKMKVRQVQYKKQTRLPLISKEVELSVPKVRA